MVDLLVQWSGAWFVWLCERSLTFGIAFVVVVPAALLLARKNWLSAHGASLAIVLPVVLLVLPCERWLPGGWPSVLPASILDSGDSNLLDDVASGRADGPAADPIAGFDKRPARVPVSTSDPNGDPATNAESALADRFATGARSSDDAASLPLGAIAFAAWSLWCLAALARLLSRQWRAERFLVETSEPAEARWQRVLDDCRNRSGIRRRVRLRLSDELPSPATTGVFHPVVYLPTDRIRALPHKQLEFVLLHELAHVRRNDVLVEAGLRCLRAAFFFHPAVWCTLPLARRWRELACDEAALARAGSTSRTPSAEALLALADPARSRDRESLAVVHLLNDGETMKTRIERMLDARRAPRRGIELRAAAATALLSSLALTAARAQEVVRERPQPAAAETATASLDDVTPEQRTEIDTAIRGGVAWLLTRQAEDGRFGLGVAARNKARDHNEAFATGLVVQALVPEREGDQGERVQNAIDRAVHWLISTQDDRGRIGGDSPMTMAYGHAQALRALCMVQAVDPSAELKDAIVRGVAYTEYRRNPYAGWRYQPRDGENDSKITALMLLALIEAQKIGIEVPEQSIELGRMVLQELTDETTGRTGFVKCGSPMSRFVWKAEDFPGVYSEEPTAMHLIVAFETGGDLIEDRWMRRAVNLLVDTPPSWSVARGSIDYSYWQYGAEAMKYVDGYQRRLWRERLSTELASRRTKSESGAYWSAVDAWSDIGMENWTTASAIVALQSIR